MSKPVKMVLHVFTIMAIVVAVATMFAPASRSNSPYLSALSDLAATPALAKGKCTNRACEFVAPAYSCLESSRTNCLSGCVTVAC